MDTHGTDDRHCESCHWWWPHPTEREKPEGWGECQMVFPAAMVGTSTAAILAMENASLATAPAHGCTMWASMTADDHTRRKLPECIVCGLTGGEMLGAESALGLPDGEWIHPDCYSRVWDEIWREGQRKTVGEVKAEVRAQVRAERGL